MAQPGKECIVIGAGIAGLHTAWRLQQRGVDYLLLEARSLCGGRIQNSGGDAPGIDLGPTWFWPHQPLTAALLKELGLTQFTQHTAGEVLYQSAPGQAPMRHAGAGTTVAGIPVSYRVAGGMTAIIEALRQQLDSHRLLLDHAVRSAAPGQQGWLINAQHRGEELTLGTKQLVAALPPRLLMRDLGTSRWASPELQAALEAQQTWMSAQAKFVAEFETAFWREAGLSGDAFSRIGPLVEIHDAADDSSGIAALFGFVGLPARQRLSIAPNELEAACLRQLVHLFGESAANPSRITLRDWARDEFTVTDRDLDELPAHADFPLSDCDAELDALKLRVAGSEFAEANPGYVEGALEASSRALSRMS